MAIRLVGNNHRGTHHTWIYEYNDNNEEILSFDKLIPLTPHVLEYPIWGNITAYYYKYHDEVNATPSYPVLYADNNGQPGEKLTKDEPLMQTGWQSGDAEGWIQEIVPMKRTVAVGEKVWFGFYGIMIAPRYDPNPVQTVWVVFWAIGYTKDSIPEHTQRAYEFPPPQMRLSMYFTYSDVLVSVEYARRINDVVSGRSELDLRWRYGRFAKPCIAGISDTSKILRTFVQKCSSICGVVDFLKRRHGVLRRMVSRVSGSTILSRSRDFLQRITSCASGFTELKFGHGIGALVQSLVTACDKISHWRVISLVVRTLCGVWERLFRRKGVHRVEIVLYSPITLELKLGKK